jgi:hypothetical protein
MHRIHYAGDSIMTGSQIARALLDYAQALAQESASATVEVPTLEEGGAHGKVELLIGPASQLTAHEVQGELEEVRDDQLVERITAETERIRRFGSRTPPAGVVPVESPQQWTDLEEF